MIHVAILRFLPLLILVQALTAQTVTRIELKIEPGARLRPMASAVIQVKVYGEADVAGSKQSGRLRKGEYNAAVFPNEGGWLSKPFRYQGTDNEGYLDTATSTFAKIFSTVASQYTVKDALVYTAPEKPGTYRVEVGIGSIREKLEIIVADDAPEPVVKAETVTFPPEPPSPDRYRKLAEHWSPYVAQETWFDWRADALRRFDYDNDWDGGNNWDNLETGSSQAYVYYAAIETASHWFLIYNFFHARDYSDNCVVGTCHENDNEGIVLTVRKNDTEFGQLEVLESLAHNNVYSYTANRAIRNGAHNIEADIVFYEGSHPVVFLEAGGHGALGGGDRKSYFDGKLMKWTTGTGITYVYRGQAARPRYGMDRDVSYDLLPIYDHWWLKATDREKGARMFSAFYQYTPFGGRPAMKFPQVGGSFLGIKFGADKAKPFWGWHDMATQRRKILATGQWAADPAYAVTRNLTFPANLPVSLNYTYNPYLGFESLPVDAATSVTPPAAPVATSGTCEVEVVVDGLAAVILPGTPKVETLSGAPAEARRLNCDVAPAEGATYEFDKREGRGKIRQLSPGRFEIDDPSRGSALYRLTVRWRI